MPIYEYECDDCGHNFEIEQPITSKPKRKCPECGGRVQRIISGNVGFLFKGTGFYTTDYRSPEYKKAEKAEKEAERKNGPKDSKKKGKEPKKK